MRVCGIDIAGKSANLVVLERAADGSISVVESVRRIVLGDGKDQASVRQFSEAMYAFLRLNTVDCVAIKQRNAKGQFSGGADGFKIEALIQANAISHVELVSPVAIGSFVKKNPEDLPKGLFGYQSDAFHAARCVLAKKQ